MSNVPNYMPGPDPAAMVKVPSILLMVDAGLMILLALLGLLGNLLGVGLGAMGGGQNGAGAMFQGAMGIAAAIFGLCLAVIILLGALKMMKLQSYGMAMTAAIVAMLPCTLCCIMGLPVGIWALVVLMKPEVKAAFGQGGGGFPAT
jgi:hypothetical protein